MLGQVFDPAAELLVTERCRPHWAQAGAIVFVTFRTHDSIPREVLERWENEKRQWIESHGVRVAGRTTLAVGKLTASEQVQFRRHFDRCREDLLDNHLGRSVLRSPELAEIVAKSLLHFDRQRYRMGDFIIMPNHVHLLCAFGDAGSMRNQFDSWLHYTAAQINRRLGEKGKFWQRDPFDHLVRSPEQYDYLRDYIRDNPKKARLAEGEFLYRKYTE